MPLWGTGVHLHYPPRRVRCDRCGGVHVEALPWVSGKRQFTRALMVTMATWARILTWKQVATLFQCSGMNLVDNIRRMSWLENCA